MRWEHGDAHGKLSALCCISIFRAGPEGPAPFQRLEMPLFTARKARLFPTAQKARPGYHQINGSFVSLRNT